MYSIVKEEDQMYSVVKDSPGLKCELELRVYA